MERLTKKHERGYFTTIDPSERGNYDAIQRFGELEDAEEQGMLIRLPCKVGDTVYQVIAGIYEYTVTSIGIYENRMIICVDNKKTGLGYSFDAKRIGKRYFLTREEAEAALTEMEK